MSIRDSLGAVISALKHMRDAGTVAGIGPLVAKAEMHLAADAPTSPVASPAHLMSMQMKAQAQMQSVAAKVDDAAMAKYKAAAAKAKGA